jgi:hypothetical protein
MKSFQTPHSVANEVRMKRTQRDGPFLIVEGADDSRFYKRFVDPQLCRVIPAFNKENVIGAITLLDADNLVGVLGVVDSDFDALMETALPSANIVRGDNSHDLETMLVRSPALDAVLHEFASPEKLELFEARRESPFRSWLVEIARCLGYLRWWSARNGTNLCFEGLRFAHFIEGHTLVLDRDAMFAEIRNRSQNWAITDAEFVEAGWPPNRNDDPWHICCGHDMVDLIAIALRRAVGSQQQLSSEHISRALRLAYSEANFANSALRVGVRGWEHLTGCRILP